MSMMFSDQMKYATGTIRVIDPGIELPYGWLHCDAQIYEADQYPELCRAIAYSPGGRVPETFQVPLLARGIIKT